jgi:hypothetical protein
MTNALSLKPDYWRYFGREAAKGGDCPLYELLAEAIAGDPEVQAVTTTAQPGQPPANMLFAAVHDALLTGVDHPLRLWYGHLLKPGETEAPVTAAAYTAFRDFVLTHRAIIDPLIATRVTNTNEVRRSTFLRAGYAAIAAETGKPLGIIEMGPSAGLNLNWDRYAYAYRMADGTVLRGGPVSALELDCEVRGTAPPVPADPPDVISRVGLELNPVDLSSEADRRWLVALLWPSQPDRMARLKAALEIAVAHKPPIIAGDALRNIGPQLAAIPDHATAVVTHSLVTYQWTEAMRAKLHALLLETSRQRPVYRLSAEFKVEGESWDYPLRLDVYRDGDCTTRILAGVHHHGSWIEWGET